MIKSSPCASFLCISVKITREKSKNKKWDVEFNFSCWFYFECVYEREILLEKIIFTDVHKRSEVKRFMIKIVSSSIANLDLFHSLTWDFSFCCFCFLDSKALKLHFFVNWRMRWKKVHARVKEWGGTRRT